MICYLYFFSFVQSYINRTYIPVSYSTFEELKKMKILEKIISIAFLVAFVIVFITYILPTLIGLI